MLVAKQVSSTAVLTGNRLLLGVGTSPWPEDYEICGVPWAKRGTRMDEEIAIMRGLMAGGYFEFHGEVFDVPSIKMCPTPSRPCRSSSAGTTRPPSDGPPATATAGCMAGATRPTSRASWRAWPSCAGSTAPTTKPFETHVISLDAYAPDGVQRLEELGVTDVIVGFRWPYGMEQDTETLQTKVDNLNAVCRRRHRQGPLTVMTDDP